MTQTKPPEFNWSSFNCPNCGAFAQHSWCVVQSTWGFEPAPGASVSLGVCHVCKVPSLWMGAGGSWKMVWPDSVDVPLPNADLGEEITADYREAESILARSPRGAAALLRLCVQKLCIALGLKGNDLNSDIAALVKGGLRPEVQQALDTVRVVGNEAVHPGVVVLDDDVATARLLFVLVNRIAESLITTPREMQAMYETLPETKRQAIETRDAKDQGTAEDVDY